MIKWNHESEDVKRRPTNLDLVFVSEEISDDMKYIQEEDTWGSDHFPVIVSMKFKNKSYRKRSNRINNYKTDWNKYMVEWWDEECKIAIEKRKKALKEFRKEKTTIKFRI